MEYGKQGSDIQTCFQKSGWVLTKDMRLTVLLQDLEVNLEGLEFPELLLQLRKLRVPGNNMGKIPLPLYTKASYSLSNLT